jgi:uncharacterized protein
VGQYQHDVNQTALKKSLDDVVESCVNRVGVDVNSASFKLLAYVAGIGENLAKNILAYRFEHGAFQKREQLLSVPRFGEKAFQQAAGFLRIPAGENPLDASAVHPEAYLVVQRICQLTGKTVAELIGNDAVLDGLDPKLFVDETFGVETIKDLIAELKKPGRDPRQKFEPMQFREGVNKPSDLEIGMELQGIVTNVTDFGAFVDVGVHQDGLVHLSEISHQYIKNPADALQVGQVVKVKVVALDPAAKRIALSIKALLAAPPRTQAQPGGHHGRPQGDRTEREAKPRPQGRADRRPNPRPSSPPVAMDGARPKPSRPNRPTPRPQTGESPKPSLPQGASSQAPRQPAAKPASLDDLLSKFNRGHR